MKLFGLARCPYCGKGINIIRIWSLRKKGEYRCPRCSGISNIYQSPLIYLFGLLAIILGFMIFFFEKYAFDNLTLMTTVRVFITFACFYVISLFLIYLEKVVINRFKRDKNGRFFDETGREYKSKNGKMIEIKKENPIVQSENVNNEEKVKFTSIENEYLLEENTQNIFVRKDENEDNY